MRNLALTWWTWLPVRLRHVNQLLSEAWIDGVYLTAWPTIAITAPWLIFLLGFMEGSTHWTISSVPHGYVSNHVVDFTQMLPLLFVATICGALSSQLGLLLVLGFAIGDFFIGAKVFIHGPGFDWNLTHAYAPQLVCYLAFFLLAVTPALTAKAMVGSLPRWLQRAAIPNLVVLAVIACAVQGISVYAWSLAATMIIRVHWLWAGLTPPLAVFDFTPQVDPWLPVTAAVAMGGRCWLSLQARGKLNFTAIAAARRQMIAVNSQSPALTTTVIGTIGTALVTTAIISGLFDSISRGLAIFILIAGLFIVRSLILPNIQAWAWWFRFMSRIPLVLRWAGAILATFALTRRVVANPRWSPQFINAPGAFGVEISCFLLGLMIVIVLLPVSRLTGSLPKFPKALQTTAKFIALVSALGLATRPVFAGICLDPFCCFGASSLLAALVVAALLLAALAFLLGPVLLAAGIGALSDLTAALFVDLLFETGGGLALSSQEAETEIAQQSLQYLTEHGALRLAQRGITSAMLDAALQIAIRTGQIVVGPGKYAAPVLIYTGNGITAIFATAGRNAWNLITAYFE